MRMAKKKKRADWDDGRTIANMNIDGMPWYRPGPDLPGSGEGNPDEGEEGPDGLLKQKEQKEDPPLPQGKPLRRLMVSATLVGAGLALVFVAAAFLFIQLLLHAWG